MNKCAICEKETKNKCSNCSQVFYCTAEHQKSDWKNHKSQCHPFKIAHDEEIGRYLITTRDIKPFEVVLQEEPLVRGPSQITAPVCLGCLNTIDSNQFVNCEKCNWPMCEEQCRNCSEHIAECAFFSQRENKVNIKEFFNPHPLYQCVSIIRCLLLRESNASNWDKFEKLESLEEKRRGSMQWKADLEHIAAFIPKFFKTSKFSEDDIMKCVGIFQINGHEVPTSEAPHVAVFHKASLLEHSCTPNLVKSFTKNGKIILWTLKPIKKNSHLSICYTDAVWNTAERQNHLMQTKLFLCKCQRCADLSELDTNYSAIKCESVDCEGLVLPSNPQCMDAIWTCQRCNRAVEKFSVNRKLEQAKADLQAMDKTANNCFKYLSHYQKWLPSQHYYMCEVKIHLVQLLGKDPKELIVLPEEQLVTKIKYSKALIELYETLAPCEARLLGTLCFELHSAIAEQARRISAQVNTTPKTLLEESLHYVEKCVNYLQYESNIFIEGHILQQARINRDALHIVLKL